MNFFQWIITWREMNNMKTERMRACRACEVYRIELDRLHGSHERLLNEIVYLKNPKVESESKITSDMIPAEMKAVASPLRNWDATRMKLEADDARKAEARAHDEAIRKVREIDELARKNAGESNA